MKQSNCHCQIVTFCSYQFVITKLHLYVPNCHLYVVIKLSPYQDGITKLTLPKIRLSTAIFAGGLLQIKVHLIRQNYSLQTKKEIFVLI